VRGVKTICGREYNMAVYSIIILSDNLGRTRSVYDKIMQPVGGVHPTEYG